MTSRDILIILLALLPGVLLAASPADPVIQKHVDSGLLHGSALVAVDGQVVHQSACGVADAAWHQPNTEATRFKIYSMTKQFTAVLVLKQAAAGKLDLQDTVSEHLPWFRRDLGERITIHQLLCHTSGIQQVPRSQMPLLCELLADEAIPLYLSAGLAFEPGSRFEYSGLAGYTILAAILEAVTMQTYDSLLRQQILEPLGMDQSAYLDHHRVIAGKAEDYHRDDDGYQHRLQPYFVHANGASSLVTTTGDLLRWTRALRGEELLPARWRDLLFEPHMETPNGAYGYGFYLWEETRTDPPRRFAWHGGGGSCGMVMDLDREVTVIMLNNVPARQVVNAAFEAIGALP